MNQQEGKKLFTSFWTCHSPSCLSIAFLLSSRVSCLKSHLFFHVFSAPLFRVYSWFLRHFSATKYNEIKAADRRISPTMSVSQ